MSGKPRLDWSAFAALPDKPRDEAMARLQLVRQIEAAVEGGCKVDEAVQATADATGVSPATLWRYRGLVKGVDPVDRLLALVTPPRSGRPTGAIDAESMRLLKSMFLRPEKPGFDTCYNWLVEDYARPRGVSLPSKSTLKRRMMAEIERPVLISKREGREAARRLVPAQQRSVADLHALEAVNIDGHVFDVFVEWEDGTIGRPTIVGIQDIYSRKVLAHRIGETESALLTRLAFADLFRDYGIPSDCVLDNGRAFASKLITGGTANRFRFKVKPTDATGVLTALGVRVHFTLPYRGSSKPIERAWRDMCDDIAKHPRVAGAYTGNKPDAKPENYRSRAIPIEEFREHVADRLAKLNAREGRRTEIAAGGSFDDAFAASYAVSPIRQATREHVLMALLEAEPRTCEQGSGAISFLGNRYWSEAMVELAGKRVIVRFDPDNLHSDVHVYGRDGAYLCSAPAIETTGFFDKAGAVRRARQEGDLRRKVKAAEDAHDLLEAEKQAELLADPSAPPSAPIAAPGVVRPVRHRGQTVAALKPLAQARPAPEADTFADNFAAGVRRLRSVSE